MAMPRIVVWSSSTQQVVGVLKSHTGAISLLAFSEDGKLASIDSNGGLCVWDTSDMSRIAAASLTTPALRSLLDTNRLRHDVRRRRVVLDAAPGQVCPKERPERSGRRPYGVRVLTIRRRPHDHWQRRLCGLARSQLFAERRRMLTTML